MMHKWHCDLCGELIMGTDRPEWFGMDITKDYQHTICAAEAGVLRCVS